MFFNHAIFYFSTAIHDFTMFQIKIITMFLEVITEVVLKMSIALISLMPNFTTK